MQCTPVTRVMMGILFLWTYESKMISKYSKILIGNEVVGNDLQSKKTTLNEWYKAGKKKKKKDIQEPK